jgi:hypothetical protein
VESVCGILDSLLEELAEAPDQSRQVLSENTCWLALIWGVGGMVPIADRALFSDVAKVLMTGKPWQDDWKMAHPLDAKPIRQPVPDRGTVFEYHVDLRTGKWLQWSVMVKTATMDDENSMDEVISRPSILCGRATSCTGSWRSTGTCSSPGLPARARPRASTTRSPQASATGGFS